MMGKGIRYTDEFKQEAANQVVVHCSDQLSYRPPETIFSNCTTCTCKL